MSVFLNKAKNYNMHSNINSSSAKLTESSWNKSPTNLGVRKTNRFSKNSSGFFTAEPTKSEPMKSGGSRSNGETKNEITGVGVVVVEGGLVRLLQENRVAMTKEEQSKFGAQPFMLPDNKCRDATGIEIDNKRIADAIRYEIKKDLSKEKKKRKVAFFTTDVQKLLKMKDDEIITYAQNNAKRFQKYHFPMVVCRERLKPITIKNNEGKFERMETPREGLIRLLDEEHRLHFQHTPDFVASLPQFEYQREGSETKQVIYLVNSKGLIPISREEQYYFCARALPQLFNNDILETRGGGYKTMGDIDKDIREFKKRCAGEERDIKRWGQAKLWERCKKEFALEPPKLTRQIHTKIPNLDIHKTSD